ncbi:STAS domain-containing protein [Streptomyces sp. NPDC051366]|uniref:STAS domain-containing protein n=1 Tax=Streptomyces sp. NPDC051366 TaxID=3365652 RepID=UPI003788D9F4
METAPALQLALTEALTHASPTRPVAVDCSLLTFCDSSGLNALLTARRAAQETGTVIRLLAPTPSSSASLTDGRPIPLPRGSETRRQTAALRGDSRTDCPNRQGGGARTVTGVRVASRARPPHPPATTPPPPNPIPQRRHQRMPHRNRPHTDGTPFTTAVTDVVARRPRSAPHPDLHGTAAVHLGQHGPLGLHARIHSPSPVPASNRAASESTRTASPITSHRIRPARRAMPTYSHICCSRARSSPVHRCRGGRRRAPPAKRAGDRGSGRERRRPR